MADIKKCAFLLLILCIRIDFPVRPERNIWQGARNCLLISRGQINLKRETHVQLAIVIQNTGLNEFKFVDSGIVDRTDLPNTAKFLTAAVQPTMRLL